jgi:hypothetical protein
MIGRCLVGVLLGFPLAALLLRLALRASPDEGAGWIIPALIAFIPLWLALMAAAFAFRSAWRACVVYGGANVLALLLIRVAG